MTLIGSKEGAYASPLKATPRYELSYQGSLWAQATLGSDAATVTIESTNPLVPPSLPALVTVKLATEHPISCTIRTSAVKMWPTASHKVLERSFRGAEQLLALLDARGLPWAQIEIGDQVHLFDPSGRERARVLRAFDKNGGRLVLRCWDELGKEIALFGRADSARAAMDLA